MNVVVMPRRGLLRHLTQPDLKTEVWLQTPGAAARLSSIGDVLRAYPEENAARSWAGDYLGLIQGIREWHVGGGTARVTIRRPYNPRPMQETPWGAATGAWTYGPGVTFLATPSHGGFKVERSPWLASIPREVRAETYRGLGEGGWFEEDEDAGLVALAFPHLFDRARVEAAWQRLTAEPVAEPWMDDTVQEGLQRRRAAILRWLPACPTGGVEAGR